MSSNTNSRKAAVGIIAILLIASLSGGYLLTREQPHAEPSLARAEGPARSASVPEIAIETKSGDSDLVVEEIASQIDLSHPKPLPITREELLASLPARVDPEQQPRDYFVNDFRFKSSLNGAIIENLRLTGEGLTLEPPAEGEEDAPRFGYIESPAAKLNFDTNAIVPLWLEDLPIGTDVLVEIAMSPDGNNWSDWYHAEPDDHSVGQMYEFYPDGSRNPNFGFTPGGVLDWGEYQWDFFKYRVTLYSDVPESPVLNAFRLYYMDSTLGTGKPVEVSLIDEATKQYTQ